MLQHVWVEGAGLDAGHIIDPWCATHWSHPLVLQMVQLVALEWENATPSPTWYLRSDKWWAGNSERNGEFRGSTGKSWFVKRLREELCWPNFALVMSPWSLPGNLMGKKQSCAKTCREFHFNEENVSFLGYFSACQGIWKKKHVKNHTCKKKTNLFSFFP